MKALMKTAPGPGNMEVRDTQEPAPGPDELLLKVAGCGICGSDLTVYRTDDFARIYPAELPRIMGHEFTGVVVAMGDDADASFEGAWVTVNPHVYDGTCPACLRGEEELCENRPLYGVDRPGGAAEYVSVRAQNAYQLPEDVARAVGALGEPLSVGVHAVERLGVRPGETSAVVGAGPIGLLIVVALQEAGVETILLSGLDIDSERLQLGSELGVETFVAGDGALAERAKEVSGGRGVDVAFEAAGSAAAVSSALELVRQGGRVGVLGLPHDPVPINDPFDFVLSQKSLIGTRAYTPRTWEQTVTVLCSRKTDLEKLVTRRVPLEDWQMAFSQLEERAATKIVLEP
jgi:threonine dehydrogenase-like Zn-dependent dehydrogenase